MRIYVMIAFAGCVAIGAVVVVGRARDADDAKLMKVKDAIECADAKSCARVAVRLEAKMEADWNAGRDGTLAGLSADDYRGEACNRGHAESCMRLAFSQHDADANGWAAANAPFPERLRCRRRARLLSRRFKLDLWAHAGADGCGSFPRAGNTEKAVARKYFEQGCRLHNDDCCNMIADLDGKPRPFKGDELH